AETRRLSPQAEARGQSSDAEAWVAGPQVSTGSIPSTEGPLAPGQRIEGSTGPLGMFAFTWDVLEVDAAAHRLRLLIRVPCGIRNDETVAMAPLEAARCRISFG